MQKILFSRFQKRAVRVFSHSTSDCFVGKQVPKCIFTCNEKREMGLANVIMDIGAASCKAAYLHV